MHIKELMGRGARKNPSALVAPQGSQGRYSSSATSGRCGFFYRLLAGDVLVSIYSAWGGENPALRPRPPPPLGGSLGDPALGVSRLFPPPTLGFGIGAEKERAVRSLKSGVEVTNGTF